MSIIGLPSNVLLRDQYPIPLVQETAGESSLDQAVSLMGVQDITDLDRFMVDNPDFDLNAGGVEGWTIMAVAINNKSLPLIQELLRRDPSLVKKGMNGDPYICLLTQKAYKEAIDVFLQNGANVNCASLRGTTALYESSLDRMKNLTKFLLLHGAVISQCPRECSLLHLNADIEKLEESKVGVEKFVYQGIDRDKIKEIEGQLPHIQEVIGEIRKNHEKHLYSWRQLNEFLENNLSTLVMSYVSSNIQLEKRFLEKCDKAGPK